MRLFYSFVFAASLACSVFAQSSYAHVPASSPSRFSWGRISGTTADPSGAVIPQAIVTATRSGSAPVRTTSDTSGNFLLTGLAPGTYVLEAAEAGFQTARKEGVRVVAGTALTLTLTLAIETNPQSVVVSADTPDTSPEENGSAIVLKADDLEALSDDPDELATELQAIAGTDAETGAQFYVDGFTAGKLPPKNSIREIRINQNPYSAQYDQLGFGRIEILTKPGTDKLHGDLGARGNNSPWNAQNPFVASQPPYYKWELNGDVDGPLNKNASYFLSLWTQKSVNNSIVNAETLDSALNPVALTQAVNTPSDNLYMAPRIDWQWGAAHTLTARYQLVRNVASNSGVGQFSLASQADDTYFMEQVLQLSDSDALSPHVLNETHFQYIRDRWSQTPISDAPTVNVQGAFNGGGNNGGIGRDASDHYEWQDILRINHGAHEINLGGRLRLLRDSNYSTGNYNGSFTFTSLTAYQITMRGEQQGWTPAQIRAAGGGASQFSQIRGRPSIIVDMADAGVFAEDNWKLNPNATFSYGLRFETQTGIHDHADYAPRIGLNWSIPGGRDAKGQAKNPIVILRGGFGIFYSRFSSGGLITAERQNGVTQSAVVIGNPDFYPNTCASDSAACSEGSDSASTPTIYHLSPSLRAPYEEIAGLGADKFIGKHLRFSANYFYTRGEHQFETRNVNAPLPGTYNPADPASGVRPLGTNENIYQYGSEGASERNRMELSANYNAKRTKLWGNYTLSKAMANTGGMGSFPSNSYDQNADWGRASWDVRSRAAFGIWSRLPEHFTVNLFATCQSSAPFNITVDQDLNGDTIFNDRPAFATDMTRPSVYQTKWGAFDADPMPGQKIIPINYGDGPREFNVNMNFYRRFNFGPVVPDPSEPEAPVAANAKTAATGNAKKQDLLRRYTFNIGFQVENVLNHPNYAPPVGVLGSDLFGESTALASTERTIGLETTFWF